MESQFISLKNNNKNNSNSNQSPFKKRRLNDLNNSIKSNFKNDTGYKRMNYENYINSGNSNNSSKGKKDYNNKPNSFKEKQFKHDDLRIAVAPDSSHSNHSKLHNNHNYQNHYNQNYDNKIKKQTIADDQFQNILSKLTQNKSKDPLDPNSKSTSTTSTTDITTIKSKKT